MMGEKSDKPRKGAKSLFNNKARRKNSWFPGNEELPIEVKNRKTGETDHDETARISSGNIISRVAQGAFKDKPIDFVKHVAKERWENEGNAARAVRSGAKADLIRRGKTSGFRKKK